MRYWKIALLGSLLGAIGLMVACMTEDKFETDYTNEVCSLWFECADDATLELLGWTSEQDCVDASETADDDDADEVVCTFDDKAAQDCLDELAAVTCDDFLVGSGYSSCMDVYTDCE